MSSRRRRVDARVRAAMSEMNATTLSESWSANAQVKGARS
jgi:hypothetical protein